MLNISEILRNSATSLLPFDCTSHRKKGDTSHVSILMVDSKRVFAYLNVNFRGVVEGEGRTRVMHLMSTLPCKWKIYNFLAKPRKCGIGDLKYDR